MSLEGLGPVFRKATNQSGHEKRRIVYNLYECRILNLGVLFGGMYLRQVQGMIDQILKM